MKTYQEKIDLLDGKNKDQKSRVIWNWIKAGDISKNEFIKLMKSANIEW